MRPSSAKTITKAEGFTYSTQRSENDDRNGVIDESSAQRGDAKTRYAPDERDFFDLITITVLQGQHSTHLGCIRR